MQFRTNPTSIQSLISRPIQIAFVAGLVLGILLGWIFSGLVGAVMRFGLLAVLLIPLALALFFWWKVRQAPKREGSGPTIVTWGGSLPPMDNDPFRQRDASRQRRDDDVIDLDELRREREP